MRMLVAAIPAESYPISQLRWLQEKAQGCDLELDPAGIPELAEDDWLGLIADSFSDFLGGLFHLFHTRYYRPIGTAEFGNEIVDETVPRRAKADVSYRPKNSGLKFG